MFSNHSTIHDTSDPHDSVAFLPRFRVDNYSNRQDRVRTMYHSNNVSMYVDSPVVGWWTLRRAYCYTFVVSPHCYGSHSALSGYQECSDLHPLFSLFPTPRYETEATIRDVGHVDMLDRVAVVDRTRSSARRGSCTIYMSNVL